MASDGELARVAWGQNNITNKKRVRTYLSRLWKLILMTEGLLLSIEYSTEGHYPAQAVKVYDPHNEEERKTLEAKIDKLWRLHELSEKLHKTATDALSMEDEQAEFGEAT